MKLAPVVIFAFNRPKHLKVTLRTLKANPEIQNTPVYIYCDGPRNNSDWKNVLKTREVILKEAPHHAEVSMRGTNLGLANSISTGVTEACKKHGRAIIIEDDLRLSPGTLDYFNRALTHYENEKSVMHISGYMFPSDIKLPDTFFLREGTCWGWATWDRAWKHFNPSSKELVAEIEKQKRVSEFNINDSMFFMQMLRKQAQGEIDSWAIRWYASMFLQNGLSLHPRTSLISNDGFDGSGVHCSVTNQYICEIAQKFDGEFATNPQLSMDGIYATMDFRKNNFLPNKKVWPDLLPDQPVPLRVSTNKPVDRSIPPG